YMLPGGTYSVLTPKAAQISRVPSVEPLSATIISGLHRTCSCTESRAARTVRALFQVGITTPTRHDLSEHWPPGSLGWMSVSGVPVIAQEKRRGQATVGSPPSKNTGFRSVAELRSTGLGTHGCSVAKSFQGRWRVRLRQVAPGRRPRLPNPPVPSREW